MTINTQPKTILLVEDEALIAILEARQLQQEGYVVLTSYSGENAIATVRAAQPTIDLILMDVDLGRGKMDGTQAAQIILQAYDIPIVFLSSHTAPDIVARTEQITSYGYVVKNTGITVLATSIKMAFRLHAANQALRESEERLRLAHKATNDVVWDWDVIHDTQQWNEAGKAVFGWSEIVEHPVSANWWGERIHSDDRQRVTAGFFKAVNDPAVDYWQGEYRFQKADGSYADVMDRGYILRDASGKPIRMIGAMLDYTERKEAEEQRTRLLERLNLATRSAGLGIWDWDIQKNDLVWDNQMYALYGVRPQDFTGAYEAWLAGVHPDDRADSNEISRQARLGERDYNTEFRVVWPDGTIRVLKAMGEVVRDAAGKPVRMVGVNYDITERKQMEDALREREEQFRSLAENSADYIIRYDSQFRHTYANQACLLVSGKTWDEYVGKTHREMGFDPHLVALWEEKIQQVFDTGELQRAVFEWAGAEGKVVLDWQVTPEFSTDGTVASVLGVSRDITELRQAEEASRASELRWRTLLQNLPSFVVEADPKGIITTLNRVQSGFTLNDYVGKSLFDVVSEDSREEFKKAFAQLIEKAELVEYEAPGYGPNRSPAWYYRQLVPIIENNKIRSVLMVASDITERKRAENDLRKALAEKDLLMRELQHRVKNSLNIVASLIDLGEMNLSDEQARTMFAETRSRIESVATVYDQLYRNGGIDKVELSHYMHNLVSGLSRSYLSSPGTVKIETQLDHIWLDSNRAIQLGIILNELVTNALKYAFPVSYEPEDGQKVIRVELLTSGKTINLSVADNGVGLSAGKELQTSTGLSLVEILAQQLNGKLTIENSRGITARVIFDKTQPDYLSEHRADLE